MRYAPTEAHAQALERATAVVQQVQARPRVVRGEPGNDHLAAEDPQRAPGVGKLAADLERELARDRPLPFACSPACRVGRRAGSGHAESARSTRRNSRFLRTSRFISSPASARVVVHDADVGGVRQVPLWQLGELCEQVAYRREIGGVDLQQGSAPYASASDAARSPAPAGKWYTYRPPGFRMNRHPFAVSQGLRVAEASSGWTSNPGAGRTSRARSSLR